MQRESKRKDRIRKACDFNKAFERGKRVASKNFVVFMIDAQENKYGVTVARRTGKAARRNFVKRRLRELVRENLRNLPEKKMVVFLAKPGVARSSYSDLQEEFVGLLRKIK